MSGRYAYRDSAARADPSAALALVVGGCVSERAQVDMILD